MGKRLTGGKCFPTLAATATQPNPNVLARLSLGISTRGCEVLSADDWTTQRS